MGRSASHVTLECALATHPNMALIGEEIAAKKTTLSQVVGALADMIIERSKRGKDFGVILIPEGLIEFVVDVKVLIEELNKIIGEGHVDDIEGHLSPEAKACFMALPKEPREQLLLGRDPHGNVQVSKIETDRMLITMVQDVLQKRGFTGKFNPQPIFCGYEGRSCLPTNFDADYCYALGYLAVGLIAQKKTGYICAISGLEGDVATWQCGAVPLASMMTLETRLGKKKPVIEKALVDLKGEKFAEFAAKRDTWAFDDLYCDPGPIQFG
jgi:pyrophosphate--fructose-6-phosphate 1-phosphotransferase